MSPSGKACPSPVPGTCWEHWDGLQREGKGGEGWEKGKGPSGEQGRAAVMAARMEGGKKKRNKNKSVEKEGKNKAMVCQGGGAAPVLQEALGGTCSVLGRGVAASLRGRSIPPSRRLAEF